MEYEGEKRKGECMRMESDWMERTKEEKTGKRDKGEELSDLIRLKGERDMEYRKEESDMKGQCEMKTKKKWKR